MAVAAEAPVASAAAPHLGLRRARLGAVLLILPVVGVLGAILGYPIYSLVRLSLQNYGLFELIRHKGIRSGSRTSARSSTTGSSGTRCCARSSSRP